MLGDGEGGGPWATLGETLFQQIEKDEVALEGQGDWSKAEAGQPGGRAERRRRQRRAAHTASRAS